MNPRTLLPGQQYTAAELNELARQVSQSARISGGGNLAAVGVGLGTMFRDLSDESIYARITGAPTGANYPYVEVVRNGDGTTTDIAAADGGRFGTATDTPAVELAARTDVPTNAIVQLTPLPGGGGWGFTYGASAGGSTLTTGNTSSGAQDSTTTVLRFDDATKIKVTKGATAGDPDIVSMDGLTASTTGLTVPGTTVSGVVTATRTLPALPQAWVRFNTIGGTLTTGASGGLPVTVTRVAKGQFKVEWTGVSSNGAVFASAIGETTNAVAVGAYMDALGKAWVYVQSGGADDDVVECAVAVVY